MDDRKKLSILRQIYSNGGDIFTVKFKRRTDKVVNGVVTEPAGSIREMSCRLGVKGPAKGKLPLGLRATEDWKNDTLTVFEMCGPASHYKRIPLDTLISINGKEL